MEKFFTPEEKSYMHRLARNAVETYIKKGKTIKPENVPQNLDNELACFVTLKDRGMLRGCIGTLEPVDKLCNSIVEMSIAAATRDHRFPSVEERELDNLEYEISVLSKPEKITYTTKEDLFSQIKGRGLIIEKGFYRSTYLPQVWENVSGEEEFLSTLCVKAGIGRNEWEKLEKSGIEYYVYDTIK